jgi:hypothetical protein
MWPKEGGGARRSQIQIINQNANYRAKAEQCGEAPPLD